MPLNEQYLRSIRVDREKVEDTTVYPYNLPVVRHLDVLDLHPRVTFFVGENGTGKSTLLEAIAVSMGMNPEGGSRNFNFRTMDSHSPLHHVVKAVRGVRRPKSDYFLRAESFYNVVSEIERLDEDPFGGRKIIESYGGTSLHAKSHGESFMALLNNRFHGGGFYVLDEPEAALSPTRQLQAIRLLHDLSSQGAQFIIATHSPILMAYPHAKIFSLAQDGIDEIAYTETEHFQVTRDFLNRHDSMLDTLLGELSLED